MKLRIPCLLALALPLAVAAAAPAVIIDSGTGTGNTSAPAPDPGWGNVGSRDYGANTVYLGDGWVLTANHNAGGDVVFGGVTYPWVPGSDVRLHNPDSSLADLVLFEIYPPFPPFPALEISAAPPAPGTSLVLIGAGRNRGAVTSWNPPGPGPNYPGYVWGAGYTKRWGTNYVETVPNLPDLETALGTQLFATVFDASGAGHSTHEAQATNGDSGGAAFADTGSGYELAGILLAITTFRVNNEDQPAETALYGNDTLIADLSVYRDEIVTAMPEPAGGLWSGAALLAWLSAGTRRACRGTGCAASSSRRA